MAKIRKKVIKNLTRRCCCKEIRTRGQKKEKDRQFWIEKCHDTEIHLSEIDFSLDWRDFF